MNMKLKVKKGDKVLILAGKSSGVKGEILKVLPKESKVIVAGVNVVTSHKKPTMSDAGGMIKKELPIHVSNVSHIDPKSGKATKVGYKILENGKKVRYAKKSGEIIDK